MVYMENICLFPHYRTDTHSLHTVNFVRETELLGGAVRKESVYKLHFVESGQGSILVRGVEYPLVRGDVFFTFPAVPYTLTFQGEYSCIYISYLGARANEIMERLHIGPYRFYFPRCEELSTHFSRALRTGCDTAEWMSESALLFAFALLGERILSLDEGERVRDSASLKIKSYIDENFSSPSLSLATIGKSLAHHPKYISSVFKKEMHVGVCQYITTVRIQHACALMDKGHRSVTEIATMCGFADGQYFSKIFKRTMGITPGEYIRKTKEGMHI